MIDMAKLTNSKKGVSAVVAMVLMVLLVVVSVMIVWGVVSNLIDDEISSSEACFNSFDKVLIEDKFTCYNVSSNELKFGIKLADIDVDGVYVLIENDVDSLGLTLNYSVVTQANFLNRTRGTWLVLPPKKGSFVYYFNSTKEGWTSRPQTIEIAPIVSGVDCDVLDSVVIDTCI